MNRRTIMLGVGALATPDLLRATPATAQAPATPVGQAPGFFRHRLGDFTVTMLHDGSRTVPLQGFVRNAPVEEVQRVLAESFLPTDALRITFTAPLVETGRHVVLIDTGCELSVSLTGRIRALGAIDLCMHGLANQEDALALRAFKREDGNRAAEID